MFVNRIAGRSASAVAFGVIGMVVGGLGIASAATGGVFILGKHNSATSVTTLANSKGPALALKSRHGKPALTVNTTKEIKRLNAAMVGGSTASSLKTSGSGVTTNYPANNDTLFRTTVTKYAVTAKLKKGTYFVTATAVVSVPNNEVAHCAVAATSMAGSLGVVGQAEASTVDLGTLTETAPVTVSAGQKIAEFCWLTGDVVASDVFSAGITAIRVDSATTGTFTPGKPLV